MLFRDAKVLFFTFCLKQINCSFNNFNKVDWEIFNQQKQWSPIITSGPTILISSNITTVHDQNGEPVQVQLSNNNVGIGESTNSFIYNIYECLNFVELTRNSTYYQESIRFNLKDKLLRYDDAIFLYLRIICPFYCYFHFSTIFVCGMTSIN